MLGTIDVVTTIAVKDLEIGRKFYLETLGLTPVDEQEGELVTFKSGATVLNVYRSEFAGTNKATAASWDVGDDLERIVRELEAKGIAFEHYDMPGMTRDGAIHDVGGFKTAWFKDPDGNILNLIDG